MNPTACTLQIFIDDAWCEAAALDLTGDPARGVDASTFLIYLPGHAIKYCGRQRSLMCCARLVLMSSSSGP
jgi:serine/threonine-protein kinase HipA